MDNKVLYIGVAQIVKVYIETTNKYYIDTSLIEDMVDILLELARHNKYYSIFSNIVFDADEAAIYRFSSMYKSIDLVGNRLYITDKQCISSMPDIEDDYTKEIILDYIATLS